MRLNLNPFLFLAVLASACASPPPPKVLTPKEQIAVDTEKAESLAEDFKGRVRFLSLPKVNRYLDRMASRLAAVSRDFPISSVEVRIHQDLVPGLARAFSFPGTFVSIPGSFLREVDFENELAALIAFELGKVINRTLARQVEALGVRGNRIDFFDENGVFAASKEEVVQAIGVATELLYWAGYDVRGVASVFQRFPKFFVNLDTDSGKKALESYVREARRAGSGFLPKRNPVVRSSEFIQVKKELKRIEN